MARLAVTEGLFYYVLPRVQSLSRFATAPFTQGSLRCGGNYAKLKLFGTTSTAGGFRLTTISKNFLDKFLDTGMLYGTGIFRGSNKKEPKALVNTGVSASFIVFYHRAKSVIF